MAFQFRSADWMDAVQKLCEEAAFGRSHLDGASTKVTVPLMAMQSIGASPEQVAFQRKLQATAA